MKEYHEKPAPSKKFSKHTQNYTQMQKQKTAGTSSTKYKKYQDGNSSSEDYMKTKANTSSSPVATQDFLAKK